MRKTCVVAALCVGFALLAAGCAGPAIHRERAEPMLSGVLDGMTFSGELGLKGKAGNTEDTLTFRDGYFHSSACDRFQFGNAPYLAVAGKDSTTFQAITRNRRHALIVWKGTVAADKLEGEMTLYEKDKEPSPRWVKATLAK